MAGLAYALAIDYTYNYIDLVGYPLVLLSGLCV